MKKHILKLRPLLLLMVLFVLANCQEDYNDTGSTNQADGKYQILTGEKALKIKDLLMQNLKDEGGLGMAKLSSIIMPNSTARGYIDIEPYIKTDLILGIKDGSGVLNYTLGVNMPDTSPVKFYNLLISSINNTEKVVLVTYNLESQFSAQYSQTGDMDKFTGTIDFEIISLDTGFPCGNIPSFPIPVTGGIGGGGSGGGGGGGGGSGGGGSPNPGNPYSQALIDAKFLQLKMVKYQFQSITVEPLENNGTIPDDGDGTYNPIGTLSVIEVPAFTGSADPCAPKQQIGIIGPGLQHKNNCDDLKGLLNRPAIKNSLLSLKGFLDQNNERLFSFSMTSAGVTYATPEVGNTGSSATMRKTSATYGVAHTHQNGLPGSPSGLYKMFSIADLKRVYEFARDYAGSGPTAAPMFFNMMVINGHTYIVFPNNVGQFKELGYIFEDEKTYKRLDRRLNALYNSVGTPDNASDETLAEKFLQEINNAFNKPDAPNLNMSLYRINNSDISGGTGWEQIELNNDQNHHTKEPNPCSKN